jgi:antitoxin ParD1/3/4
MEEEMARNTSVTLGEHFEGFIAQQLSVGRYESKSEVVRAAMRLLEERERKIALLTDAIAEGESSGYAETFDIEEIIRSAKAEAGLSDDA